MAHYWHNIGKPDLVGDYAVLWGNLVHNKVITAGFGNHIGGRGEQIVYKYDTGDILFAYANGYGLVGVAKAAGFASVTYQPSARNGSNHRHEASVDWLVAFELANAISPQILRDRFGLRHPRQTSEQLPDGIGEQLLQFALDRSR